MNYDQLIDWAAGNAYEFPPMSNAISWTQNEWDEWLRKVLPEELLMQWGDCHCAWLIKEAFPEWE